MSSVNELPIFDPLDDELMFPVPYDRAGANYRFSRPMHVRLVKAALELPVPAFFHSVQGGSSEGARGCISLIRLAREEEEEENEIRPYQVEVICAGRGEIKEITQSFPFAKAIISEYQDLEDDDDRSDDGLLQREAFEALRQVAALSTRIEAKGPFAEAAAERLEALQSSLARLQEEELEILAAGGQRASLVNRRERAGFFLLTHLTPSFDVARQALCTTSGSERLEIFRDYLSRLRADLAARAALDSLKPQSSAQPQEAISIKLQPNQRLSYWWSPEDGWFDGRIAAAVNDQPGFYDVDFLDGEQPLRLQLDATTRARWRLLQAPGDESQRDQTKSRGGADLLFGTGFPSSDTSEKSDPFSRSSSSENIDPDNDPNDDDDDDDNTGGDLPPYYRRRSPRKGK